MAQAGSISGNVKKSYKPGATTPNSEKGTNVEESYKPGPTTSNSPDGTNRKGAKGNYTAQRIGNDKGSINFGKIHQNAACTKGVSLNTPDGNHTMYMDIDGKRKGWTTFTGQGNFQLRHGTDNEESSDTIFINAVNGNIDIIATNGKIRMQGTDIELNAVGSGSNKGNIRLNATENIAMEAKALKANFKNSFNLVSSGNGRITANSQLTIYSSIYSMVDDSCAVKPSKNGGYLKVLKNIAGV